MWSHSIDHVVESVCNFVLRFRDGEYFENTGDVIYITYLYSKTYSNAIKKPGKPHLKLKNIYLKLWTSHINNLQK